MERGNILGFLKENFPEIEEKVSEKINIECLRDFDFAIMLIEYYKQEKKLAKIDEVISWNIAKYVANIQTKTNDDLDTITFAVHLLSYIIPLHEDFDLPHFRGILSTHQYNLIKIYCRNAITEFRIWLCFFTKNLPTQ